MKIATRGSKKKSTAGLTISRTRSDRQAHEKAPPLSGVGKNYRGAHADRGGARVEERSSVVEGDAARGDDLDLGHRTADVADESRSERRGGKELHERRVAGPRVLRLGRGCYARNEWKV